MSELNEELLSVNLYRVGVNKYPIIKTNVDTIKCFFNFIIQKITKTTFATTKIGTNKLSIAKVGEELGEI